MRWILFQFRDPDDVMLEHEQACFLIHTGIAPEDLTFWNVLEDPPDAARIAEYDGYFMGGSGDYALSGKRHPGIELFIALVPRFVAWGKPMFGACFGLHLLIEGLGGAIGRIEDRLELGTYSMMLTEEGAADPVFGHLPGMFDAQMGHHDWVLEMPPDNSVVVVAGSESAPCHAIRVGNAPIYATQFHPELTEGELGYRLRIYDANYTEANADVDAIIAAFRPTPECLTLLSRFVEHALERQTNV
ncbi:MAG: hypothetical protein HKN20_12505 [Gemmatimonadetes bacterium]|nr:hypothetical protein [Gemmatimonadota bacterium]